MSKVKTRPIDMANYLNDEEDVTAYLQAAVEDGDPALLAAALGDIDKVQGVTSPHKPFPTSARPGPASDA